MKIFIFATAIITSMTFGQNNLYAVVYDKATRDPLSGANVLITDLNTGAMSDNKGEVYLNHIPEGTYIVEFSFIGYKSQKKIISFKGTESKKSLMIYLEPVILSSTPIQIKSTRTNGVLKDEPVRIEVLGNEEVREETAIKPGNIAKLLGETTGIQIQQTSAASGNVSFRIQGLDGKYTQLLKDGFPMYSGFSGGLS
ncbi:MAG: TonB-dependent receptor plug domain-containing protein, partial [FCB group bacterium]|nr:TonB-dependent receptor plug domain-containing protein [FCB group bacterium]